MTVISIAILNMSLSATVIAFFVLLIRIFLKKSPKIFSYLLWGVLLLRLICPFSFSSDFSLIPKITNVLPQDIIFYDNLQMQNILFTHYQINYQADTGLIDTLPPNMPFGYSVESREVMQIILGFMKYIWLSGFIFLVLYAVIGYIKLKQRVYYATLVCENIYETDQIKVPFVLGFICPKIYLPVGIKPSRYDFITEHERIHIKRKDYIIKPIAFFALALHWFNPLMWLCYFLMSKDMEMSCDEAVLQKSTEDIRRDYSYSLLQFSTANANLLYPLAFGENDTKTRIKNVLLFKKPTLSAMTLSLLIVILFFCGFSFNLDFSTSGQKELESIVVNKIDSIDITGIDSPIQDKGVLIEDKLQIIEIVNLLKNLEISRVYFPISNKKVQFVQYDITMNLHEMIAIGIYGNHIVINGQWYVAKNETCEQLIILADKLAISGRQILPDIDMIGADIIEFSDDIKEKTKSLVRNVFLDNYGINDGKEMSKWMWNYIDSFPEKEKINIAWTLHQIWHEEYQRIESIVRENITDWNMGKPFDRDFVNELISRDRGL